MVKEKKYLFIFTNGTIYEMYCGINLKDAIWEMSKYTEESSMALLKGFKGFEPYDLDLIKVFNGLASDDHQISKVYIYEEKIYG